MPTEHWHLVMDAIDTTGRAFFLGMTLRWARCHDHKFGPITKEDYYAGRRTKGYSSSNAG